MPATTAAEEPSKKRQKKAAVNTRKRKLVVTDDESDVGGEQVEAAPTATADVTNLTNSVREIAIVGGMLAAARLKEITAVNERLALVLELSKQGLAAEQLQLALDDVVLVLRKDAQAAGGDE